MRIDLHMHSTFSDGMDTPTKLVEIAKQRSLAAISLTDHDCLDGVGEATEAGERVGVEVLPGVELSSEFKGRDLHILGYGVDPEHEEFEGMLKTFRDTRHKRGIKIVEKLNALGVSIEPAEVLAKAEGAALGRPHVAAVLVERGFVSNTNEAFNRYLAEGQAAYIPKYKISPSDAIDYVHRAGGLAFMAHPGIFLESMEEMLELVAQGFDGVEVYHPQHNATRIRDLEAMAEERGLLVSGGSDYHGFPGRDVLGGQDISYALVERIKERLDEAR